MAYTYGDDPSNSTRDAVRFLIQDTKKADGTAGGKLVTDSEITFALASEANVFTAGALCCDVLVSKGGAVRSRSVGDVSITYDVTFYKDLAKRLRSRGQTYAGPYAGGLTETDKAVQQDDTDATQPDFKRGEYEYPGLQDVASEERTS